MRSGWQMVLLTSLVLGPSTPAVAAPPVEPASGEAAAEPAEAAPEPESAPGPEPAAEPVMGPSSDPVAEVDVEFWRAHIGMDVDLVLDDQTRFAGHLLGIEVGQLIAARRTDGTIVVIPASRVVDVSARRPRPEVIGPMRSDRGTGLLAAGASLAALGGLMFVGALFVGLSCEFGSSNNYYYRDCTNDYVAFLAPGAVFTAAGVPMIVGGKRRQKAFRAGELAAGVQLDGRGFGLRIGGRF